jgi:tetratricopeptide (TPR) repeat protein
MAMKYCDKHEIWYDYNDSCPECTKFGRIAGNIIGGSIFAVGWAGKKIYDKIKEDDFRSKERQTATNNRIAEFNGAIELLNFKKYEECIAYCDQAIKINPNNANFWSIKGRSLYFLNKYNEAIACYDQAIKLNPNSNWQSFKTNALKLQRKKT